MAIRYLFEPSSRNPSVAQIRSNLSATEQRVVQDFVANRQLRRSAYGLSPRHDGSILYIYPSAIDFPAINPVVHAAWKLNPPVTASMLSTSPAK